MNDLKTKAGSLKHNMRRIREIVEWVIGLLGISFNDSLLYEKMCKLQGKVDTCFEKAKQIHESIRESEQEKENLKQQIGWLEEEQFSKGHLDPDPGIQNGWDQLLEMAESDSYNRDDVKEFLRDRGVGEQAAKAITFLMYRINHERFEGLEREEKSLSDLEGMF